MPYLNLDPNYFDHPKTKRLVALLKSMDDVLPIRLWAYCSKYHPIDGKLKGYSADEFEGVIGWFGRPGEALSAMLRVGFVVELEDGYACSDWTQHQGHLAAFSRRGKAAAKARWSKYASSIHKALHKPCKSNAPAVPNLTLPNHTKKIAEPAAPLEPEIVKPKTTLQRLVEAYKVAKGVDVNDKPWDKVNFPRCSKSAKNLLGYFNDDLDMAAKYIFIRGEELNEKGLDWTLETITRHAFDGMGIPKEDLDGIKHRKMESTCIPGSVGHRRLAPAGEVAGETLRAIEHAAVRAEGTTRLEGLGVDSWENHEPFE